MLLYWNKKSWLRKKKESTLSLYSSTEKKRAGKNIDERTIKKRDNGGEKMGVELKLRRKKLMEPQIEDWIQKWENLWYWAEVGKKIIKKKEIGGENRGGFREYEADNAKFESMRKIKLKMRQWQWQWQWQCDFKELKQALDTSIKQLNFHEL